MLDEYIETTPNFYGLLNTMKRVREGWETKLVVDSFPQLYTGIKLSMVTYPMMLSTMLLAFQKMLMPMAL